MVVDKRLQLPSGANCIKAVEGRRIVVVDGSNAVRFFSIDDLKLLGGFKTALKQNEQLPQGSDVSGDGLYVAFSAQKAGALVFHALRKKLQFTFDRHDGDVESLCFNDPQGYLATGGQDGKTFVWSMETGKLVASLPHHADFVGAIAFSHSGLWAATGSYDRKVWVTNLSSLTQRIKLRAHGAPVSALHFLKGHRLISGDKGGEIIVWDYFAERVEVRLKKLLDEVVGLALTPDHRFLFAADRSGIVALYDMQNYELMSLRYLTYPKPIRKIAYIREGNYLVVALENGVVTFNSPLKEEKILRELIAKGAYGEAFKIVEENPLLRYGEAYERLQELWDEAFEKAVRLYEAGEGASAQSLLAPFAADGQKRLLMQQLAHDFEDYDRFRQAVESRKYQLAYSMAAQYPMLKRTALYRRMEEEWERVLAKAKQLILKTGNLDALEEAIKPFRGISSKNTLLHTLLKEKGIYQLFIRTVRAKDYLKAMELAKKYPAITEMEEYKKIEKIAEALEAKAKKALERGDYAEAMKLAKELEEFPHKREIALQIQLHANRYATALRHFAEKDYKAIYRMLEKFPYLEETDILRKLEGAWQKVVKQAERHAAAGEAAAIRRLLGSFLEIPIKREKIVTLFKTAYLEQIETLYRKKEAAWEEAVERYIELFGVDDALGSWLRMHGLTERFGERPPVPSEAIDPKSLPERLV